MTLYVPAFLTASDGAIRRPWRFPARSAMDAVDMALLQARTEDWRLVQVTVADTGENVWRCRA